MEKKFVSKLSKKVSAGVAIVALSIGCATSSGKGGGYGAIDDYVLKGEYPKAVTDIQADRANKTPKIYPKLNDVLFNLDKGTLEHYASQYEDSFANLEAAEDLIKTYQTKSISEGIASLITNDNAKTYAGEAYEDVYDSVFNSLNIYHLGKIPDAQVEARQINEKLATLQANSDAQLTSLANGGYPLPDELKPTKPSKFSNSALGNYLCMILLRDKKDGGNKWAYDQIKIAYAAAPDVYTTPVPNSVAEDVNVPAGKARLNVLAFTGLSPIKAEEDKSLSLPDPKFLVDRITLAAAASKADIGTILTVAYITDLLSSFKLNIKLPKIDRPATRPEGSDDVTVEIEGQNGPIKLELLENIGNVITATFNAGLPAIAAKTYARSIVKTVTATIGVLTAQIAANKVSGVQQIAAQKAVDVAKKAVGVALEQGEAADIRMARYLPNKAFVGGITLDPGTYKVKVKVGGQIVFDNSVEVQADQPNIIEAVSLK